MDRQRLRPVARQMLWHLRELAKLTDILPLSDTERAARRSHFAQMLNSVYELGSPETPPERIQQLAVKGFGLAQFYMIADREAIERMPPGPEREGRQTGERGVHLQAARRITG